VVKILENAIRKNVIREIIVEASDEAHHSEEEGDGEEGRCQNLEFVKMLLG